MKQIGITETFDPCFIQDWETRLLEANVIISKELSDEMVEKLCIVQDRVIFHHTVTGQGGSVLEPGVETPETEFIQFTKLIEGGFPLSHYVLRLDPIILLDAETQSRVVKVLDLWKTWLVETNNSIRCRVSIVDLYPHVKERLAAAGITPFYGTFTAPRAVFRRATDILAPYSGLFRFESCAERDFQAMFIRRLGCASEEDLKILGVNLSDYGPPAKKQRGECMCLAKKQILGVKPGRCAHGCLYCFWK